MIASAVKGFPCQSKRILFLSAMARFSENLDSPSLRLLLFDFLFCALVNAGLKYNDNVSGTRGNVGGDDTASRLTTR
ncbi:unnamed protein product [Penicillium roqueforti FM164]|uniref:Genomic scaffold, ProqFM164S03 n=1 Tax=Penicillium roqueforti (strain FM164) TaxID=1365484 RepID=W6QD33_PENRF|nr:unnamed protein product [Penicillium roqueforti FM164]